MNRRLRTYYYAVFGAIGGLAAWQVSNLLGLSFITNIFLSEAVVGALVGLCIGLLIGVAEGLLTLNLVQAARSGGLDGLFGLLAGAVGLPLGEWLFQTVGAGFLGRALGWAVFGLLIGLAEGMVGRSQLWKGLLGGLLGGSFGGLILEGIQALLKAGNLGKAIGLTLLGASIGAFISLVVVLLSRFLRPNLGLHPCTPERGRPQPSKSPPRSTASLVQPRNRMCLIMAIAGEEGAL